jgi:hypothetical protein
MLAPLIRSFKRAEGENKMTALLRVVAYILSTGKETLYVDEIVDTCFEIVLEFITMNPDEISLSSFNAAEGTNITKEDLERLIILFNKYNQ